jgi:hypothetical protein
MARATVLVTACTKNAATADAAGTALDATNGHAIPASNYPLDSYLLRLTNTTAAEKIITIKAGDNPPAASAGQGDLAITFAAGDSTAVVKFVTLESARFMQDDGTILIDMASGTTGFVSCWRIPR